MGDRGEPRWYRPGLIGITVGALVLRVVNVLVLRPGDQACAGVSNCFAINGDSLYGHLQGELIAQGRWFASSFGFWLFGEVQPGAGDPPLYALYLGLVSALHGSGGTGARFAGLVVLGALVGATWWIARRIAGPVAGRVALATAAVIALLVLVMSVLPGFGSGHLGVERGGGSGASMVASVDDSAVTAHRLASAVLGAVGVALLGVVGRRIGGPRAGLIAAGAAAINPMLWINDGMVLSESLYVPMVALVILAGYRFWDRPGRVNAALMGVAIALAALTRAEALLLVAFMALPLAWGRRRALGRGGAAGALMVCGVVAAMLVAPWLGFNLARFEEPTFMTAGTGAVLSAGSCDVAYDGPFVGYYGANCFQQYVDDGWVEWPDERAEESVRDIAPREGAVRYIRDNLAELPRVAVFRVARIWNLYKPFAIDGSGSEGITLDYQIEGRGKSASWAGLAMYFALWVPAIVGTVHLARRRIPLSPLIAQAIVVTVTAAMTFGVTRYRVPADAALVVLAAVGIDVMVRRWWPVGDNGDVTPRPLPHEVAE